MKLYTEEQIKSIYRVGIIDGKCGADINNIDYLIFDGLTPIELPSDEEIGRYIEKTFYGVKKHYFKAGVEFMKELILNQNK
jgi:hypothetical protein